MTQIDTNISDLIQIDIVSNRITFLVLGHGLLRKVEFIYYYISYLNTKGIYCTIAFFGQTQRL